LPSIQSFEDYRNIFYLFENPNPYLAIIETKGELLYGALAVVHIDTGGSLYGAMLGLTQ
jgi:hypothetical protein